MKAWKAIAAAAVAAVPGVAIVTSASSVRAEGGTVNVVVQGSKVKVRGDTGDGDVTNFNPPQCWHEPYKNGKELFDELSTDSPMSPDPPDEVVDHQDDNKGKWWVPRYVSSPAGTACAMNLDSYVWVEPTGNPPTTAITVEQLAYIARASMKLTEPKLSANPTPPKSSYVGLGTWVWAGPEKKTRSVTASIEELNLSATVTATRTGLTLNPGTPDASRFMMHPPSGQCSDLGVEYTGSRESPPCGVTYQQSSADQADKVYTLTGSFTWNITWSGGTMPSRTYSGTITIPVGEVQTTN